MSGGTDSFQTEIGKESLALRAKACAKALPCRCVWEKEKYWKEPTKDIMSFIKWPTSGWWKHCFLIAEIEVSKSPSKIEPCRLSSWRKWTTLRAATVSNANTDDGQGIISNKAAMTVPEEFQTTTPMPAAPKSSKIAPSKFVFKVPGSSCFQMIFFGNFLLVGLLQVCWNSERYC